MPLDVNKILTPAMIRIVTDATLKTKLGGTIQAAKGARRPTSMIGQKCFTVHVLSNNRDEDSKAHNGTLLINFYCSNYQNGNANVELMGPVSERLVWLFDDKPLAVTGWRVYDIHVQEPLGPLFDSEYPNEHFMSVRVRFGMIPNTII